jgi:HK97 family phage prohead protease
MDLERRHLAIELRADAAGRKLAGYAARFNVPASIGGAFTERILAGAFRKSLQARADILALVDHAPDRLLARTRSGTLRLSEDGQGLTFELDVPDTQLGRDVLALAVRGDIGGMSFGFTVPDGGDHWPDRRTRELRSVELVEVSVVHSFPAYEGTSVAARHRQSAPPSPAERRRYLAGL